MRRIIQEHRTGCGIACVATITNHTYSDVMRKALQVYKWDKSRKTFYTTSSQLRSLLFDFGIVAYRCRSVRKWSSISDLAIVGINYKPTSKTWHWVVFRREAGVEQVLDPLSKKDIRTDLSRMRLRLFIPIDLTNH